MINHTNCRHRSTVADRQTCRILRQAIAQAERFGLEVEADFELDTVGQVRIYQAGRPWYGTSLCITGAYGHAPKLCVMQTTQLLDRPAKDIPSWIATLAH